jgi:hypothetical protein
MWIKELIKEILSIIIIPGGLILFYYAPEAKANALIAIISAVVGYWFGTSASSAGKNTVIKDMLERETRTLGT